MNKSAQKRLGQLAVIAFSLAGLLAVRGCMNSPPSEMAFADDQRPDPHQPFPNMNGAGCFLNSAGHERPQLQLPADANQEAVLRAVAIYVGQLITTETRQLNSAATIQQHVAGATSASVNAFTSAIASGVSPQLANQAAMVAAAQYLHNQGIMGPLICPVALGFDKSGSPMVK